MYQKKVYTYEKFYQTKFYHLEIIFFMWIFGLGSDLYNDTIGTGSISRMREHTQFLCNLSKPHLRIELCSYITWRFEPLVGCMSTDVNRHLILRANPISIMIQERKKHHVIKKMVLAPLQFPVHLARFWLASHLLPMVTWGPHSIEQMYFFLKLCIYIYIITMLGALDLIYIFLSLNVLNEHLIIIMGCRK